MHFANSGEAALKQLRDGIEPTLIVILSDINMAGMDGLQLLRHVKEQRPDMPVTMVTAYGDDERRRRARELGAFEFLSKPSTSTRSKRSCANCLPPLVEQALGNPDAHVVLGTQWL